MGIAGLSHQTSKSPPLLQPAPAWIVIIGFVLFTTLACVVGLGKAANLAFPVSALLIAIFLYFRYPILYIGFTWWLWFLTPLVRRLLDYQSGFTNPSPVLLAPVLATLVTLVTFLKLLPKSLHSVSFAYVLSILGIMYGYFVGLVKGSPTSATIGFLEWLSPILLSFHIFVHWKEYPYYRQNVTRVFLWCALITGVYGVIQYLIAPSWDQTWLIHVSPKQVFSSFGEPKPLGIRVWSTMHGPGVFAQVMMAVLLLLLSNISPLGLPATIFGYLSFLLSSVRSAWIGWVVGIVNLFTSLKPKLQIRLTLIIIIGSLCIVPLTTIEPFSSAIVPRLETLTNLTNDGSRKAREENYSRFLNYALTNLFGDGIGNNPGLLDSQILEVLINLGWFGLAFYGSGLFLLVFKLISASNIKMDSFASSSRAITVAMLCQIGFGSIFYGLPGVILWSFMGLGLAAQRYHKYSLLNKEQLLQ